MYGHVITKFSGMGRFTKLWGSANNDRLFPEKYTVKDHISDTKLEKYDHCYIETRHKDLFFHYNLILRKL